MALDTPRSFAHRFIRDFTSIFLLFRNFAENKTSDQLALAIIRRWNFIRILAFSWSIVASRSTRIRRQE